MRLVSLHLLVEFGEKVTFVRNLWLGGFVSWISVGVFGFFFTFLSGLVCENMLDMLGSVE